ncbi:folate-binding protein YgfZ [Motiliproteus sp. MSK22-1]|uniref:CAF17-like 4Fe-4S cluster assembly/insertion protein YgfZ n=1 Tax=Motiliproteus sp. MSK22-1 TaxID=1897630 RepID=UPI0009F9849E|nr:folate-binding protein YgfZ [Motiliproteus sp. MSK22-1]
MSNPNWIEFLKSQGAKVNEEKTQLNFADTTVASDQPVLVPLIDQALLKVEGPDAEKFLQGQLSCDLKQVSSANSLLGSNCTPKGNVISAFRLIRPTDEQILLRMPKAIREPALANLGKYIVFSKAELTDASDSYTGLGLQGAGAEALIKKTFGEAPDTINAQLVTDDLVIVRVPGLSERFELWVPGAKAASVWEQLIAESQAGGTDLWKLAEIQAGLVQLDLDSVEVYLPQMLNLQALEGISFSKGCYTGQEVVARLQHRGKLKKYLMRGWVDSTLPPTAGMNLHSPNRRNVGKILSFAPATKADSDIPGYEVQAVISKSAAEGNLLHLDTQEGPQVELLPLPYNIDPELFER